MNIVVINGPNLNMLGIREPDKYGNETYEMLTEKITVTARIRNKGRILSVQSRRRSGGQDTAGLFRRELTQ